jgi:hypothetical protein
MEIDEIITRQRDAYRSNFLTHGDSPLGTFQNNQLTQYLRFESLIGRLAPHFSERTTVHDVGSGICDLKHFLDLKGLGRNVVYSGTEIVEEMNDRAREKYPDITLFNRDFIDERYDDRYDFVVLSGTLNIPGNVQHDAWWKFCLTLIDKMFERADKGIAFNFLTAYRTFSNPDLFYIDPRDVFDHVTRKLSNFVHLEAAYPLYECTLTVFRKEFIESLYPNPDTQP